MYSPTKKEIKENNSVRISKNPKKIIVYGSRKLNQNNHLVNSK